MDMVEIGDEIAGSPQQIGLLYKNVTPERAQCFTKDTKIANTRGIRLDAPGELTGDWRGTFRWKNEE
jgi:hypothetical protein